MTTWTQEFSAIVAEAIDYYQANRRFLQGEVYNVLTQRSFCGGSATGCAESWDAVEFVDPDVGDARVFVFRNESEDHAQSLGLEGLVPLRQYEITGVDHGPYGTGTADVDGRLAVTVTLPYENSSEILEIE